MEDLKILFAYFKEHKMYTVLMQRRRHWLMIPACGLHDRPGILPQRKNSKRHLLKANLGMRILFWPKSNFAHWPQDRQGVSNLTQGRRISLLPTR